MTAMESLYRAPRELAESRDKADIRRRWRRFRRYTFCHRLVVQGSIVTAVALLAVSPMQTIGVLFAMMSVSLFTWLGARSVSCPHCSALLLGGKRQKSYTASLLGLFPGECTSCGVEIGSDAPAPYDPAVSPFWQ